MAQIKLGNLLWRSHTRPISPEDPVDVKDVNAADIKTKLEMVQSELALVKAELQEIKANQLSGDQKVQLSGTITTLSTDPAPEGSEGMTWLQHNPTTGETKVFKYISGDWREL